MEQVARTLLELGLEGMEGVVYVDDNDDKMARDFNTALVSFVVLVRFVASGAAVGAAVACCCCFVVVVVDVCAIVFGTPIFLCFFV